MKRLFLVLIVVFSFSPVARSQDHFDFRKTTWGMTKEQVKFSEASKPVVDRDDSLVFVGEAGGNFMRNQLQVCG